MLSAAAPTLPTLIRSTIAPVSIVSVRARLDEEHRARKHRGRRIARKNMGEVDWLRDAGALLHMQNGAAGHEGRVERKRDILLLGELALRGAQLIAEPGEQLAQRDAGI